MKVTPFLAAAALLVCLLALPALPDHRRQGLSSTKEFRIDGKTFLREKSTGEEISPANSIFEVVLREVEGTTPAYALPVPKGLRSEHLVQMVSDSGPVDLAVGAMDDRGVSVRNRLHVSGWQVINLPYGEEPIAVATFSKGKESFIVFLEEKSGKFLLVRKAE